MVVAFDDKEIRMLCENEGVAENNLGTSKLKDRLADIFAASTVRDLLVGSPQETEYNSLPAFKVDIDDGLVLYFLPNHVKMPFLQSGQVDWDKVNRVKIVAIKKP